MVLFICSNVTPLTHSGDMHFLSAFRIFLLHSVIFVHLVNQLEISLMPGTDYPCS